MLYDKIKRVCEKKGISISMVEKKANLSKGALSKWNNSDPSSRNLKNVADILECTVDELLSEDEKK